MEDYNKQATDFLTKTNTTFKVEFLNYGKYFESDTDKRDIYKITLQRGERVYKFNFGQSINCCHKLNYPRLVGNTKRDMLAKARLSLYRWNDKDFIKNENFNEPTAYDVLSCLTKSSPETLEDFCDSYGYSSDSIKANNIYKAVVVEWQNVAMLWNDLEIEKLQEIN